MKNILSWVTSNIGQALAQGAIQSSLAGIGKFFQSHVQTTRDIQDAWERSYEQAVTSLQIALKGPAIWAKTAHKEFSLSFEAEVMEPFCQQFSRERELQFRCSCLLDLQKLRQASLGKAPEAESLIQALTGAANIDGVQKMHTLQRSAEEELRQSIGQVLGSSSSLIELLQYRNVVLMAIQFHFNELVKDNQRLRTHLDLLHKRQLAGELSENQSVVLQAMDHISQQQESLFGAIAGQLNELSAAAKKIELSVAHIRQDCSELKAGQLEILCGLEIMRKELKNVRSGEAEILSLQSNQALLARDYRVAREGYLQLAQKTSPEAFQYHFFALAAGLFYELRRGRHNCRPLVEEFQTSRSILPAARWGFKDCRLLDFLDPGRFILRFEVEWQGQKAELLTLSPMFALRKHPAIRSRFLHGIALLKKLASFPCMPNVLAANLGAAIPYYIVSWARGKTLAAYIEEHSPGVPEILLLMVQLAQILEKIHQQQVALRTFHAHNLFFKSPDHFTFHDLELAKDQQVGDLTQTDIGLSLLAELPHYAGKTGCFLAADIEAFGRVLAYLFTQSECPEKQQFPNPNLTNIFARCIDPDPQKKYSSMSEVVSELQKIRWQNSANVAPFSGHEMGSGLQKIQVQNAADVAPSASAYVKFELIRGSKPEPNIFYEHDALLVGRGGGSACRILKDRYASRVHCILEMNPPLCSVKDLGSTNGTFINGRRYNKGEGNSLTHGDTLKVGHTELKVHIHKPAPEPTACDATLFDDEKTVVYHKLEKIAVQEPWSIYRALHPETKQPVRLKVATDQGSFNASRLKRFLEQVNQLKKLEHPNIARFYSGNYDGIELHLATEWVEGKSIEYQVQSSSPQPLFITISLMQQLLSALEEAHKQGIVHRKLHPRNLAITQRGLKIIDLGVALHFDMSGLSGLSLYEEKEADILFTAPEQIQDYRKIDRRSDIYSAGAIFFYLLTGQPLFDLADQDPMFMVLDEKTSARRLNDLLSGIDSGIEQVIARCVEKDPTKRYQTVGEVLQALQ